MKSVLSNNSIPFSENNKWEFIDSGFHSGIYNMDFDLKLVEKCKKENIGFLRFYRWKPYAISLGYNQSKISAAAEIDLRKCRAEGIDVVTRPTGGRAVFHSEELTYSIVFRSKLPTHVLYEKISNALIKGIKLIDCTFSDISFTKENPDLLKLIKKGNYNLCFNTSIKNEINYKGKKIAGSAQRKFGDIVLQHGSIMLGDYHKNIINYLNITGQQRLNLKKEIEKQTSCLNHIAGRKIDYSEAANALFAAFKKILSLNFIKINRVEEFISSSMPVHIAVN